MDLRRLRKGEWITAISGIALFVSLFLPWWKVPAEGAYFERSIGEPKSGTVATWDSLTAWQVLSVTDVLLGALAIFAIAVWLIAATARNTAPGIAAQSLLVPFALVMSIVCLLRVLNVPEPLEPVNEILDIRLGYGAWIGLAATFGVLIGDLLAMRDERLSKPGQPTDQTGVPVSEPLAVERLPGPPPA
jgi:hypothetical protein